jgi:acetyl esterase/lipase
LVIYVHGGGWLSGDSSEVSIYLAPLIERGFAVASVNHRWSTNATFPAQIHDVKGAVRWLRANALTYDLDPNRIAAFGDSTGAHVVSLLGTSWDVAALEGDVGGNLEHSSRVEAVGHFMGPSDLFALGEIYNSPTSIVSLLIGHPIQDIIDNMDNPDYADWVALVNSANPITHISADDPQFYLAHGADDDQVPPSQSELLYTALIKAGVSADYALLPGFGHELPMWEYEAAFDMFVSLLVLKVGPPDVNCDGDVDVSDLLTVINDWGACPDPGTGLQCPGDVNADGFVNVDDLLAVIQAWG